MCAALAAVAAGRLVQQTCCSRTAAATGIAADVDGNIVSVRCAISCGVCGVITRCALSGGRRE
jgi:hypothetical protein